MDELKEKINKLEDFETPASFHARMVSYILDKKLKAPFYVLFSIFSVNLLFSILNLLARLKESEALSAIKASVEGFTPTMEFFSDLATTLKESFPGHAFIILVFNLAFVVYAGYLVLRMRNFNRRKVDSNLKTK